MDLNLVVLCGRLAAPGELREYESGSRELKLLLTVRSEEPRQRVDVVPVTVWNPDDVLVASVAKTGVTVWVAGSVQRRFWPNPQGTRSGLQVVASQATIHDHETSEHERV